MTSQWKRTPNFLPDGTPIKVYGFSEHLKEVGDCLETFPLPVSERRKFLKAAHIWAYRKGYTVKVESVGYILERCMRVTLIKKYRQSKLRLETQKMGVKNEF